MDKPAKDVSQLKDDDDGFAALAEEEQIGFFQEFWEFLKFNKKWWMTPLLMAIFLMGLLVVLSGTGVAPFIYTLF